MAISRIMILCAAVLLTAGCGGGGASIEDMVAGGDIGRGDLVCWLMLKFDKAPGDAKNVVVKFHSDALEGVSEFDWEYISTHDVVQNESGWGHSENKATTPDRPPPPGETLKVRFPLKAKRRLELSGATLWLNAEVYWGGELQDSEKDNIRRLYQREDGKGMPGTM